MLGLEELQKLRVVDLKDELVKRNLPTTGKKDELIARLLEGEIAGTNVVASTEVEETLDFALDEELAAESTTTLAAPVAAAPVAAAAAAPKAAEASDRLQQRAARFGLPIKGSPAAASIGSVPAKQAVSAVTPAVAAAAVAVPVTAIAIAAAKSCHTCGGVGHVKRTCPSAAGGATGPKCHTCGGTGHVKRDCTTEPAVAGAAKIANKAAPAAASVPLLPTALTAEDQAKLTARASRFGFTAPHANAATVPQSATLVDAKKTQRAERFGLAADAAVVGPDSRKRKRGTAAATAVAAAAAAAAAAATAPVAVVAESEADAARKKARAARFSANVAMAS